MKRLLPLCVLSGVVGAVVALVLTYPPKAENDGVAQENGVARQAVPDRRPAGPPIAPAAPRRVPPSQADLTAEEIVNIAVYESCNRSVVHINTRGVSSDNFFFEVPTEGEGSGSVIDAQGHVVTNFHVIQGAREIQVTLFNGKSYEGDLVGFDEVTDVAVLKIDAPNDELFSLEFGDSSSLRVGQRVYAIGNPFGLERTLSTGIIASLNRWIPSRLSRRTIRQIIQIDAAINPGNSGGPLLDTHGRLIGMNTAIASKTGESAGVGFAIPVNTIARVVPQLITSGRVVRPNVGIQRVYETEQGLLVAQLTPGGAAEKAGLRGPQVVRRRRKEGPFVYEYRTIDRSAADLIVAVDGRKVRTGDDFLSVIEAREPGDRVVLTIVRDGKEMQVPVTLEASD